MHSDVDIKEVGNCKKKKKKVKGKYERLALLQ
jgi:hypothetical protein